jgi:hypothetical protein
MDCCYCLKAFKENKVYIEVTDLVMLNHGDSLEDMLNNLFNPQD